MLSIHTAKTISIRMISPRRAVLILSLFLAAALVAGCGSGGGASPPGGGGSGGSITVLSPELAPTFDPAVISSEGCCDAYEGDGIYDNLFEINYSTGQFVPRLALSLTPSTNATVWTMKLRSGVKFSDGTPFNAQAVAFNWNRIKDTPSLGSGCLPSIATFSSLRVTGPLALSITLKKPNGALPQQLFGNGQTHSGQCMNIASPAALKKYGAKYGTSPGTTVGAGAFTLRQMGPNQVTLVRNPNFWDKPQPYLSSVVIELSPNDTTAANAIESGTAQLVQLTTWDSQAASLEQAGYQPYILPMNGSSGVAFNASVPPLNNVDVREALTLASNPAVLNNEVSGGKAPAVTSWYTPGSFLYDPKFAAVTTQATNNLAKARSLITAYEAQHPGGVHLTITSPPQNLPIWTVLQQEWQSLPNVHVSIDTVTSAVYPQLEHECKYQIATGPFAADDASGFSGLFGQGGPQNYCHLSDPVLNRILDEVQPVTDPVQTKELLNQAAARVTQLDWFIAQYRSGLPTFAAKSVINVKMHDPSEVDLTQLQTGTG